MDCIRRNSFERDEYEKHMSRKDMAYRIRMMNHNMPLYVEDEKTRCEEITFKGNLVLCNAEATIPEMDVIIEEVRVFNEIFHARLTIETQARRDRERAEFRERIKRHFPFIARILRY